MIFVIDDNIEMAECIARATGEECAIFSNVIEAMNALDEKGLPQMILMEVILTGPDGFTFLNEISSYTDTAKVPVVLVTSVKMPEVDFSEYGVVKILNKETMEPRDIRAVVCEFCEDLTEVNA